MSDSDHPDDTPAGDDPTVLASLYLDDEATIDERALVETDPDALVDVERFGQLRDVLAATTEPASLSEREGHLAAALDVWERMSDGERRSERTPAGGIDAAAAAAVTTPSSSSDTGRHRRRRPSGRPSSQWVLGAAAALILLAGVGAVFLSGLGNSSDDSADIEPAGAPTADTAATEPDELESQVAAEVADENTNNQVDPDADLSDRAAVGEVASDAMTESTDAMSESEDALDTASESGSGGAVAGDAGVEPAASSPPPPADVALTQLDDLRQLATFANLAVRVGTDDSSTAGPSNVEPPTDPCAVEFDIDRIVDVAVYQGTEVVVGVDLGNERVYAYTQSDCTEVARTTLSNDPTIDDG